MKNRWDWERLRVDAFSCGLTPTEFWKTTPAELALVFKARGREIEEMQWLAAWHLSGVVNLLPGNNVTPAKLMGKTETVSVNDMGIDAETFKAMLAERSGQAEVEDVG